jgi:hypothetical protein
MSKEGVYIPGPRPSDQSAEAVAQLFPQVDDPVAEAGLWWDFSGALPLPRWDVRCPSCGATRTGGAILLREFAFHERGGQGHRWPYRCDVRCKCVRCSMTWAYGVPVPLEQYNEQKGRPIGYREAMRLLGVENG